MLTGRVVLLVSIFTLFITSCSELPKNDVEGVSFTYKTYVKESESSQVIPFNKEVFNLVESPEFSFFRGTIYTEVILKNSSYSKKSVIIGNNDKFIHNYRIYKLDSLRMKLNLIRGVDSTNFSDGRSFHLPKPNFRFELPAKSTNCYYLCSVSDGRVVQTTPFVTTLDNYLQMNSRDNYKNVFFYGSLFIIFLINIFFWSIFKNNIHGYYSFYILFNLILFAGFDGYFHNHGVSAHDIDHIIFIVLRACVFCLILFTSYFLNMEELAPKFHLWVKNGIIITIIGTTSYQFIFYNSSIKNLHKLENLITSFWVIIVLVMLIISLKSWRSEVKYYLLALFTYLIFLIIGGVAPYLNFLKEYKLESDLLFKIATIIEAIIFTYTIIAVIRLKENTRNVQFKESLVLRDRIESENNALKSKLQDAAQQRMEFLSILKLIQSNLNNEEEWSEFKNKVNEINPEFLKNLQATHQELSKNDLRLLLLVKMGFTQNEIAEMLFIAESSVKKSKQRIRKKLKIPTKITLSAFLSEF